MSLQSLLSIARSALLTHQRAMSVTAHNVANAETPGYSRQRLEIVAADPQWGPWGPMGRGVTDLGVSRARAQFFDAAFRRDSASLGGSTTMRSFLGQIEAALGEPSDGGIAAALDGVFHAFGDLANDPPSSAMRDLVRSAADRLVHMIHGLDGQIQQSGADAMEQLNADVTEINTISRRIAELTTKIIATGGPEHSAPDLEDQRDLLIDRLSGMVAVRATRADDGSMTVTAGNVVLIDKGTAYALQIQAPAGGPVTIGLASNPFLVDAGGGSVTALLTLVNTKLPALRQQLDGWVASMVAEFNQIHRLGYNAAGINNVDFFDPTRLTAGSISLSAAVSASSANIAAGATPAPGDGNIALQLAGLATTALAGLGGRTLRDYYVGLASGIGLDLSNAMQDEASYGAVVDHDDMQRQSVSGVSVEEEMVNLIGQQQAFSAAARIIRVADEMMKDVLNIL